MGDKSGEKKDGKAIGASHNLLKNIISFLPYPTFIIDREGVVRFWNKAMEDMTHVKAGQIIGKGDYEYSIPFYGERRPILIDLVSRDHEEIEKKYPLIKRDRENERLFGEAHAPRLARYWDGCASVLHGDSGEVLGAIEIIRDITEAKNTRQELVLARQAAEAAAQAKSEFLANMSHEIRTPMNAILGLSYLMGRTELNGKQRDYLDKIRGSAQHLLGIINDILDFSKIEAGKIVMEETDFDLEEVLDHVSNIVGHAAYGKGLELYFNVREGTPALLRGDPLRLGQILINLANNAVKFTEKGYILITVEQRSADVSKGKVYLKFNVADTGIGITEEQKTKLFRSFSQADASTTRKYGGTGLGLAISKKLVELMGGALGFESEYGKGSNFFFTLPFAEKQGRREKARRRLPDLKGMKVLIVDDQDVSLEVMRTYMESMNFRVVTAGSGREALKAIEDRGPAGDDPFRIIIMDWKMPGMDGVETLASMRGSGLLDSSCAVMMASAYSLEDVKDEAAGVGARAFLTKPVTPSGLLDTLMNIYGEETAGQEAPGEGGEGSGGSFSGGDVCFPAGCKVLLAEDNLINQQVAVELLENAGLEVKVANNGREAIDLLGGEEYACVLMDLQMPVMDGFEATKAIRGMEKFRDIPIIAMTAHAMDGDRERCLEAGMNDHTPKPVDPEKLFRTLARWILGARCISGAGRISGAGPEEKGGAPETAGSPPSVKAQDGPELPDSLPGINMDAALKLVAGNKKLFRNILIEFADSFRGAHEEISALLADGKTAEAGRLTHTIKGTAGNIGAHGLQHAASALEEGLKENDGKKSGEALASFKAELNLVLDASAAVTPVKTPARRGTAGGTENGASSGFSREKAWELGNLLRELEEKVRENSFDAPQFFEDIGDISGAAGFAPEEMEEIGKALNGFDYDGALKHVRRALVKLEAL
ncbi:MAG: response regulator [Nitrospiraceae bacterium]|nr:response regulator [Nitrospiraceae bacterium]